MFRFSLQTPTLISRYVIEDVVTALKVLELSGLEKANEHDPSSDREQKFTTSNIDMLNVCILGNSLAETQQQVEDNEEAHEESKTQDLSSQNKESGIVPTLKNLAEESLQISELSEMEKTYANEVTTLLKQLIIPLNTTFHVRPSSLSKTDNSIQDVVLTQQGMICVIHSHGTINSRPLETFSTEILLRVLTEVIPEARKLLIERRQKITGRVGSLEKIAKELRKMPSQSFPVRQSRSSRAQAQSQATQQTNGNEQSSSSSSQEDALKATLITNSR